MLWLFLLNARLVEEVQSTIDFITSHSKAIWGGFHAILTQGAEDKRMITHPPSRPGLSEEEKSRLDCLLDFNTKPERLSETNRLLLATKEALRPLTSQQDAPCLAALNNMMRLTLLVQNTRLEELRVVSACEYGFAAITQLHATIERVLHDVSARRDSDV